MSDSERNPIHEEVGPERDREHPGIERDVAGEAETVERLLNGLQVSKPNLRAQCEACGDRLYSRDSVTVTMAQHGDRWTDPVLYCNECNPDGEDPNARRAVEARATLGILTLPTARFNRLVLTDVTLRDYCPTAG